MLIIRKEQLNSLRNNMLNDFYIEMKLHLKNRFPEQIKSINDEQLHNMIVNGVQRADGYKITDKNDVKRFLEYLVQYGKNFGESIETKWSSPFLYNKEWSGTLKMDKIDEYDIFVISLGHTNARI